MAKKTSDSEILTEGCQSYHRALFAVMEFRRQAADAIWQSIETHRSELADATGIAQDVFRAAIPYAEPNKIIQTYDGTQAQVGFRIPRSWKQAWQMYFFLCVDDDSCEFWAQVDFRQSDSAIKTLRDAAKELGTEASGFEADGESAWISEAVSVEGLGLIATADSVLDRWIKLWKSVGGPPPLIPKAD